MYTTCPSPASVLPGLETIARPADLSDALRCTAWGSRSPAWRPLVLRLEGEGVLAGVPGEVEVSDTLISQLAELTRIRNPGAPSSGSEILMRAARELSEGTAVARGVWVFYPWSRRFVHLLDEQEFAELRTNRNHYKITPAEQRTLAEKRIGVIGLSVGQSAALTLATERAFGEIRLADFDTLDACNLNRLRGCTADLGVPKVILAARQIAELDPFLRVECFTEGVTPENAERFLTQGGVLDLLVEECDSLDVKFLAREHARRHGIPVLMETSDRGMLDVERFDTEPGRPLLHGLAGDLDYRALAGLTPAEKLPHVARIAGVEKVSDRLRASAMEIGETIVSWPQLGSAVALGGAVVADTARRILLGEAVASGRYHVDLPALIPSVEPPAKTRPLTAGTPAHGLATPPAVPAEAFRRLALPAGPGRVTREQAERIVGAAITAPSGGNLQPWRWASKSDVLLLMRQDWEATLLDFRGLASAAACGAAAENARLMAATLGLEAVIDPFPEGPAGECVAVIRLAPSHRCADHDSRSLASEISRRHTNRRLAPRQPAPPGSLQAIRDAAQRVPGVRLDVAADDAVLGRLGRVLARCQQHLLQHPRGFEQVMGELNWTDSNADRGIPLASLELSRSEAAGLGMVRHWPAVELTRHWGVGGALGRSVERAVACASALCLVSVPEPSLENYFEGGRAMQRAWLAAARAGLAVQPLSPLPYLRERARAEPSSLGDAVAESVEGLWDAYLTETPEARGRSGVLVFRIAVAPSVSARSRRTAVGDVLTWM